MRWVEMTGGQYLAVGYTGLIEEMPLDKWLSHYAIADRSPTPQLLLACPDRVRHAIWMHFMWGLLVRNQEPAVRAMARAFIGLASRGRLLRAIVQAPTTYAVWAERDENVSMVADRLLNHTHSELVLAGRETTDMGTCNAGLGPGFVNYWSEDCGSMAGCVGELIESQYDKACQHGRMVRCSKATRMACMEDLRVVLQPYHAAGVSLGAYSPAATRVVFPRSFKLRSMVPKAMVHAMEQLTGTLRLVINRMACGGGEMLRHTLAEIELFKERRETFGMGVIQARGNVTHALEAFDITAITHYLLPRIEPVSVPVLTQRISIPGLNGKTFEERELERERDAKTARDRAAAEYQARVEAMSKVRLIIPKIPQGTN